MTTRSAEQIPKDHTEVTTTMQRNTRRIIAAVAVIALLAAGGAAFTASITGLDGNNANIGFGSETVTGATANSVNYALSTDGQFVDEVQVNLSGDFHTGYTFTGAVTDGAGNNGAGGAVVQSGTCTAGAYTGAAPASNQTPVTCEFESTPGTETTGVLADTVNGFELSVAGNNSSGTSETLGGGSAIN
jgi:hypothetical protein